MISEPSGRVDSEHLRPPFPTPSPHGRGFQEESGIALLSPKLRAELLDWEAWGEILMTYGKIMGVAVALTDSDGHVLGKCHNPQPVWTLVHDATHGWTGCPFCVSPHQRCMAVAQALEAGEVVSVRDQAGLSHVAVPLSVGKHRLGAVIAGQVFDRYPDPLLLARMAKEHGVSTQEVWDLARKQRPIGAAALKASSNLLFVLGNAFLRQRYAAILETKLADANAHFRLLVEAVGDHALFTVDPNGRVTSWNIGAEHMFGYLEAEIVGQNFSCIFTPEDIQNRVPEKHLSRVSHAGQIEDEGWRIGGNSKQFWANVHITTLLEATGPARGFAIIVQDVTERRNIVIVLEEARQERARLQEKLLSHVSHELRTPLTAIYLFTTNVLDGLLGDLNPEQRKHLTFAVNNIRQLKSMVSDLLDITRVDTQKLTIEPQHLSLVALIAEVLSTCSKNAATKKIGLRSEVAADLPFVWADSARVRQILINLVDNGIKFTRESGTVTVEGRLFAEDEAFLRISVSDTGCGISPENCAIVFERLAQVKNTSQASRSGLGLGLFIARDLVLRQGGRIWLESQAGRGSTFYFTLPVFSLAKLCARIFNAPNLQAGSVTFISVDVREVKGADQADIATEIREVLERCIHPAQDVLLPAMNDAERTFFIVACADANGFEVIASRIGRELKVFDTGSQLGPIISSTTLLVATDTSREEQASELVARIEQLIQGHLLGKEKLK